MSAELTIPSKEDLVQKYEVDFLSMGQLAEQYNRSASAVRRWFKIYGIGRRSVTDSSRIRKGTFWIVDQLTPIEESLLRGSLLGDGNLQQRSPTTARYSEIHCLEQRGYLEWKTQLLIRLKAKSSIVNHPSKFSSDQMCLMYTAVLPCLERLRKEIYVDRIKRISKDFLEKLDPLALAAWYQDDGYREPRGYHGELMTHCFSPEDLKLIIEYFKYRWNIVCYVIFKTTSKKTRLPVLYFPSKDANRFLTLIEPHKHPVFEYKWFNHKREV
jgi:recombination protein RecA